LCVFGVGLAIGSLPVQAQDTDALERVQREAIQQQAEQALLREAEQRPPFRQSLVGQGASEKLTSGGTAEECVEIRAVHFEGATLFSPTRLASLHLGHECFSLAD